MLLFSWIFVSHKFPKQVYLIQAADGCVEVTEVSCCSEELTRVKPKLCSTQVPCFHLSQDHRAAAALSRHLWQPGEDEASSRGLVEASVCAQRGKAKNGK